MQRPRRAARRHRRSRMQPPSWAALPERRNRSRRGNSSSPAPDLGYSPFRVNASEMEGNGKRRMQPEGAAPNLYIGVKKKHLFLNFLYLKTKKPRHPEFCNSSRVQRRKPSLKGIYVINFLQIQPHWWSHNITHFYPQQCYTNIYGKNKNRKKKRRRNKWICSWWLIHNLQLIQIQELHNNAKWANVHLKGGPLLPLGSK